MPGTRPGMTVFRIPWLFAPAFAACLLFRRNDRQQQIGRFATAKMQAGGAVKYGGWPVFRFVVEEWTAAGQFVLEVRQLAATRPAIFIILAAYRQTDAITCRHRDRSRPDLDIELHRL